MGLEAAFAKNDTSQLVSAPDYRSYVCVYIYIDIDNKHIHIYLYFTRAVPDSAPFKRILRSNQAPESGV